MDGDAALEGRGFRRTRVNSTAMDASFDSFEAMRVDSGTLESRALMGFVRPSK